MSKIKNITATEVLDSRGNPTVSVMVETETGIRGMAMVPSGASTGKYEAHELRDKDPARYCGKGVMQAVSNVNKRIKNALCGMDVRLQTELDAMLCSLDGTANKSSLGANAILGVSMAAARAGAATESLPLWKYLGKTKATRLPVPMMNILNGGAHAKNGLDVQEFMILPVGAASFAEGLRMGCEIYHALGRDLSEKGFSTGVGDEGGFAPEMHRAEEALDAILRAVKHAGYSENEVKISMDVAASEWYKEGRYCLPKSGECMDTDALIRKMQDIVEKYPVFSIEDPLGEDDMEGFRSMTASLGDRILIVGDDLFVTNTKRLEEGIHYCAANAILIKPNQIGTVTETLRVIDMAKKNGYAYIISHRSGETEDSFIADLAVATEAPLIKTGAPCRSERVSKYNRLLMIDREIEGNVHYGI